MLYTTNRRFKILLFIVTGSFLIGFGAGSLIMFWVGKKNGWNNGAMVLEKASLRNVEVNAMYEITNLITSKLAKFNVNYWLWKDTLVDSLRNQPPGPASWNHVIELAILEEDNASFNRIFKEDELVDSVEILEATFGYQLRLKKFSTKALQKKYYMQIFVLSERDGKFGKGWYCKGKQFEKFYLKSKDEIFPLKKCQFWDFQLSCPNNSAIAQRGYKKDILEFGNIYKTQGKQSMQVQLWESLSRKLLIPAMPASLLLKLNFTEQSRTLPEFLSKKRSLKEN